MTGEAEPGDLVAAVGVGTGPDRRLAVDLRVPAGTTVAVVGPNGAGKTTLLRSLAGLLPVEPGSQVRLGSDDLTAVPPDRRQVGYVPQEGALFPHLSVRDNVAYGIRARGSSRDAARAAATTWLHRLELTGLADRRPATLSGGQAQRVALARALAVAPRLLLLDEPTAALDAEARLEVRHLLLEHLTAFPGVALVVSHDPTDALALADRIVVLEAGAVVQDSPPDQLLRSPRSRWTAQLLGLNAWRGQTRTTDEGRAEIALDDGGTLVVGEAPDGGRALACTPPSAVALYAERPTGSPRNVWAATVGSLDPVGHRLRVSLDASHVGAGPAHAVAEVTRDAAAELGLTQGATVWVSVKATEVTVTPL